MIRAESVSDQVIDKLKGIATRDYWQSTAYDRDGLSLRFAAYSSGNPRVEDVTGPTGRYTEIALVFRRKSGWRSTGPGRPRGECG